MIDVPRHLLPSLNTFPQGSEVEKHWRESRTLLGMELNLRTAGARQFHFGVLVAALQQLANVAVEADATCKDGPLSEWLGNVKGIRRVHS